ncbi:hypothetical protein [Microbacterium terrisoli]|uniref:hypothetical protein n=1 Tax=Microbacterium terrisoli TaxID=3242192 RepID=UPI002803D4DA|nr:hypothetical protein [Microbacterium protaetiae]
MISSLLPGLRDVRVPLAAGFMWLVVLWLIFYSAIPSEESATGLAAEVYRVLGVFGPAGLTAAVTFVAYLLGMLMVAILNPILNRLRTAANYMYSDATDSQIHRLAERTLRARNQAKMNVSNSRDLSLEFMSRDPAKPSTEDIEAAYEGMVKDVPLVATRLLAHHRELFDRYDRADAEAMFRYNIVIPILLIGILIPIRLGAPWWGYLISVPIAIGAVILLLRDATSKASESNEAIYQAVFVGETQFPTIDVIKETTEELRAEYKRREEARNLKERERTGRELQNQRVRTERAAVMGKEPQKRDAVPNDAPIAAPELEK